MADLALEESFSGEVRLYDINFEAAKTNEIIGNRISEQKYAKSKWRYRAVKEIGEALDGADFVIISILPGKYCFTVCWFIQSYYCPSCC